MRVGGDGGDPKSRIHVKSRSGAPAGFFECEAAGLEWLRVAGGPEVARVRGVSATALRLEYLTSVAPTREAATDFGRRLAVLHGTRGSHFGTVPPRWGGDWFFGPLHQVFQLPAVGFESWVEFYVSSRLRPLRALLQSAGFLDTEVAGHLAELEAYLSEGVWSEVCGFETVAPARVHGDLWSGNVMWTNRGGVLIDPAAHTNHPYTDLAMLELFGCPYLDQIFEAYFDASDLPRPTRRDIALHQIFPIGMHVVLFGSGYRKQLVAALSQTLE